VTVSGARLPLGLRPDVVYGSQEAQIEEGEALLLLTDGLPEAQDDSGDPLGYDALESLLAERRSIASPAKWLGGLFDEVERRTRSVPDDDWTAAMLVPSEEPP
jgi:serine phosphatase RsbU (regulator of sigma subunit)